MTINKETLAVRNTHAMLQALPETVERGALQVNAYNIPTGDNTLSDEVLAVLSQPIDGASDITVTDRHIIQTEFYDEIANQCEVEQEGLENMSYHKPARGCGPIFNVHRETCWKDGLEYDETGAPIGTSFDPVAYSRKLRKVQRKRWAEGYDESLNSNGNLRGGAKMDRPFAAIKSAIEGYKSDRSEIWDDTVKVATVDHYLDDLSF